MMGTIISNTKTRFGKYRPWVLIGAIVNCVFLVLMFTARVEVNDANIDKLGWWNVVILGLSYLFWGMSFTRNDVSFWSILPTLAKEKKERDNLTTMLAVFASVGAFAAGGLVPILTPGNMIVAYRIISIVFAVSSCFGDGPMTTRSYTMVANFEYAGENYLEIFGPDSLYFSIKEPGFSNADFLFYHNVDTLKEQFNGGYTLENAVTGESISWETNGYVNKIAIQYVIKDVAQN